MFRNSCIVLVCITLLLLSWVYLFPSRPDMPKTVEPHFLLAGNTLVPCFCDGVGNDADSLRTAYRFSSNVQYLYGTPAFNPTNFPCPEGLLGRHLLGESSDAIWTCRYGMWRLGGVQKSYSEGPAFRPIAAEDLPPELRK
jgi:hypothetical protein